MMASSPFVQTFSVGRTYRLHSFSPSMLGGTMKVRTELRPADVWGNRILLADFWLDKEKTPRLGQRVFVETGYAEVKDSYGSRLVETEIASLQGIYPLMAKAYAVDELPVERVA